MARTRLQIPFLTREFRMRRKDEILGFFSFLGYYIKRKVVAFSNTFEKHKNKLVKFFLMKRGRYNRPFLHLTTMGVLGVGVLVAPYLADTYPIFSSKASESLVDLSSPTASQESIIVGENVFQTDVSEKPRDKILTYTAQKGDTLSTVAKKFGISTDTIKWSNDLTSDDLAIGDELQILPVSGIAHKVTKGDTIYSIAKKYDTEAQKVADFPFNDFANPENFALVEGQMLIVPDGIKPSERPSAPRRPAYYATGPATQVSGGGYTWPLRGGVSQFASWYHMALDIMSDYGAPIVAAQSGTVTAVSIGSWDGGYGNNVWISSGAGQDSHYAHMQAVNVSVGQQVVGGRTTIGTVGLTGRTTGAHLHFEIRSNGALVNPISYLQ